VQFIAALSKHELKEGTWPEFSKFLESLFTSQEQSDVELGMFTMSVLTDIALDIFAENTAQFVFLFNTAFNSLDNLESVLGYYTVVTMTRVAPICESDPQVSAFLLKIVAEGK